MLREAVAAGTALGRQAKSAMDAGQLVSDDIVLGIIHERITRPDARNGFILDGFPRNLQQAEALDQLLNRLGRPLDLALLISVDVDALIQRLVGRRTCLTCGQMYNVFYAPPHMDGRCDACGGRLRHRSDDNEETIGNRLRVYETQTLPVLDFYRGQEKLRTVQGVGEVADVYNAIAHIVDRIKVGTRSETRRNDAIRAAIAKHKATRKKAGKKQTAKAARTTAAKTVKRKATAGKAAKGSAASSGATGKTAAAGTKKAVAVKQAARQAATTGKSAAGGKKKTVGKKVAAIKTAGKAATARRPASNRKPAATPKRGAGKKSTVKKPARKRTVAKNQVAGKRR